ncbi:hypothetical protein R1sor_004432 [Riccia sorocarpa]|uniref:FCP1 homology domain-containing protein n=1 Tax=Riccia sorocarpa TaxID=122646 RepID=A0ABD3HIP7_9MARC
MPLVDFTFGPLKSKLAFIWTNSQCTDTGLTHPEKDKPLVRKEVSKLWSGQHGLPWGKDVFGPSNTILIDDDPRKFVENPPNTGIVLKNFKVTNPEDDQLVKLQGYLELLAEAEDVQKYMELKPYEAFELEETNSVLDTPSEDFKLDDSDSLDFLITKALSLDLKVSDGSSSATLPPSSTRKVKAAVSSSPMHGSSQEVWRKDGRHTAKLPSTESGKNVSIKVYSYPKAVQISSSSKSDEASVSALPMHRPSKEVWMKVGRQTAKFPPKESGRNASIKVHSSTTDVIEAKSRAWWPKKL